MNRRRFIKSGALFVPTIFIPRLIRAGSLPVSRQASFFDQPAPSPVSNTQWLTLNTAGTPRNNFGGVAGNIFTLNSGITITAFRRYVFSGSTQTHRIGMWDSGFTLLATASLNTTGLGTGLQSVPLGTPITPTVSGTYYFGSEEFNGGDSFYNDDCSVSTTAVATITFSSFHSDSFDRPDSTNNAGVRSFVPVSFDYHL